MDLKVSIQLRTSSELFIVHGSIENIIFAPCENTTSPIAIFLPKAGMLP